MNDTLDINIRKVNESTSSKDQEKRQPGGGKKKKKEDDAAKNHFEELSASAEKLHGILEQKKSPYRFCVYREGNEVFIDIVILDAQGGISKTIKKNITHQEFVDILTNIERLDGIIVDCTA